MKQHGQLCLLAAVLSAHAVPMKAQNVVASVNESAAADTSAFARRVTVQLRRVPAREAVIAVANAAGVRLVSQKEVLDLLRDSVSLRAMDMPLGQALQRLLSGSPVAAVPVKRDVVSIEVRDGMAARLADGSVAGTVTDAKTKLPLRGAMVSVDGAARGVRTDEAGRFRISAVTPGEHRVVVKMLGYGKVVKTVSVVADQTITADVGLEPSVNALDQVVVTGTVVATELRAVPNAITIITAKQIEERGITRIDQLFRGDVPGLFSANVGTGKYLGEVVMYSRGTTSLDPMNGNPIKTYVDGVEMSQPQFLSQIDPRSIDRIEILTGPQASTIYGSNALNGVMEIFTKRGGSSHPQLNVNLMSGLVQSNFNEATTPQHDYSAIASGVDGHTSYNAGATWTYMGAWSPVSQFQQLGGFGASHLAIPTALGSMTFDASLRRNVTRQREPGNSLPGASGQYASLGIGAASAPLSSAWTRVLTGQTSGLTVGYAASKWWSHEFALGQDESEVQYKTDRPARANPGDTLLYMSVDQAVRRSMRYTTTANFSLGTVEQTTVTIGTDQWRFRSIGSSGFQAVGMPTLATTGQGAKRSESSNRGAFLQARVGLFDQLYITYGLRAEWNSAFGANEMPSYAPQYGVALTRDWRGITAKMRATYGRSTRPPDPSAKLSTGSASSDYGVYDWVLANPNLGPEYKQGAEFGMDLYLGSRASLKVTRYNETVENLIVSVKPVDSVRSLVPYPSSYYDVLGANGYGYIYQSQNLNLAGIRNQGWDLQGTLTAGALTSTATYSWTRPRSLGLTALAYQYSLAPYIYTRYKRGATYSYLAEHTWAFGLAYAQATTSIGVNVTGTGQIVGGFDALMLQQGLTGRSVRLPNVNQGRMKGLLGYMSQKPGYALIDLNVSHRFSHRAEAVLQVLNLANKYQNDRDVGNAVLGRQSKAGIRIRL